MKKEKSPYLNLDKATSLYLPLEPIEARADYRFAFRLPNGDEEWLLARLCAIRPDRANERFQHCVVLRPEKAEESRIFVADNLWYRSGRREIDNWMTPVAAKKFKWDLFEQSFNDNRFRRGLARYWSIETEGKTILFEFGADGWGKVVGFIGPTENTIHRLDKEGFIYRDSNRGEEHSSQDLKFLRTTNKNFRRKIRTVWNDQSNQIHYALYWMSLINTERDAIAFECKNGNWQALTEIAKLVIQVRLSHLKKLNESVFNWDFVDYGGTSVDGASQLDHDDSLFLWRFALTCVFQTTNIGIAGVKIDSLPLPLWSYISNYDQQLAHIEVSLPTKHELIEATLKLDEWAKANFTEENSRILMNSFTYCSDEDKQKFYESLNANDSL